MSWYELSMKHWRADLEALCDAVERRHCNPFHTTSRAAFTRAAQALHMQLPALPPVAIIAAFAQLLAMLGDGHTRLDLLAVPGLRRLPLRLYAYADGLAVQATTPEHAALLGGRLLAIDRTPVDELWARLRPLASRDNEQGVRAAVPRLASLPELLHAAGVSVTPERATVTAALPDGRVIEATLHAADTAPAEWVALWDATDRPPPHWRARPHGENWWTLLDDRETLYVQYSSVRDAPGQPLAAWFDAIFACISAGDVSRLVLDLRRNGGGNMALNQPLLHYLIRCDSVNQWGRLFVVIGRDTFSAAMLLAVDLERHTQALFVGEPTGSRPNAYGENVVATLAHSGLTLTLSGLWWQHGHPADTRPWIEPAIPAALSIADDRANHDPVLAAIATYGLDPAHTVSYAVRAAAWIGLAAS